MAQGIKGTGTARKRSTTSRNTSASRRTGPPAGNQFMQLQWHLNEANTLLTQMALKEQPLGGQGAGAIAEAATSTPRATRSRRTTKAA